MNEIIDRNYIDVSFNLRQIELFADILRQEPITIEILKLITDRTLLTLNNSNEDADLLPMTIKEITENILINRKVAVKRRKAIKFDEKTEFISRKMAEGIVNNLQFASLVYFKKQGSYKTLFVTPRGLTLHFYLEKSIQKENGFISEEEFENFLNVNNLA